MHRATLVLAMLASASIASCCGARPSTSQTGSALNAETLMTHHAKGTFNVKLNPADLHQKADGPAGTLGRMTIDKQFHGGIEGTSVGEMLTGMGGTGVKGSAGYVAIERVTGTLDGKRGSFILQHTGSMNRGAPSLSITVVPDSGTDELAGLTGVFELKIVNGVHEYDFAYTLAPTPQK
jgi:hypothetical protein